MAVVVVYGFILALLQHPVAIDESLRHIAMAKIMAEEGIMNQAGWGQFFYHGYFTQKSSDPWFLYHVLLVPLAHFPTPFIQKIIILGSVSLLGMVFNWICRWLRLSAVCCCVLLAILLRSFLARPALLISILSIFCYALMMQKHWEALFATLVFATLLSHLFVFPLLMVGCGILWRFSRRMYNEGLFLITLCILAVLLGIWLHPHSGNYWDYLRTVFTKLPFLLQLDVGTEMMSGFGREASLLAVFGVLCFAVLAAKQRYNIPIQEFHTQGLSILFTICCVQLLGFFVWVRMIDFLWPVAIVTVASVISFQPYLITKTLPEVLPNALRHTHVYLCVLMIIMGTNTGKLLHTYWTTDQSRSLQPIETTLRHLPTGSNVLTIDWDLFPLLMSIRPDLHYARGMDPGFNYLVDKRVGPLFTYIDTTDRTALWFRQAKEVFTGTDVVVLWSHKHPQLLEYFRSTDSLKASYPQGKISLFTLQ